MTKLKPFQKATVESVLRGLFTTGSAGRFLVADEVGLGKTVVAQDVIRQMMARKRGPLQVIYVCSSLSIASQNRRKLLEVLPEGERIRAACIVDRLTLMPASDLPDHEKLHLFTITPESSIPTRKGQRRDGRVEERALIHHLVQDLWPNFFKYHDIAFFQRSAYASWEGTLRNQKTRAKNGKLRQRFNEAVREELGLEPGWHVVANLRTIKCPLAVIARLRNALAASALRHLDVDLVIFDEFQRFRDLLGDPKNESSARIISRLRGDGSDRTKLLLLSATPYRLYSTRYEDIEHGAHHEQFFELIEFLYGKDLHAAKVTTECRDKFKVLRHELRKNQINSIAADEARRDIQQRLGKVMARTERGSHPDGRVDQETLTVEAPLSVDDLAIFRHLSNSFSTQHSSSAVTYWSSIPLPMQTMSTSYVARKMATPAPTEGLLELSKDARGGFLAPERWPHPRLAALTKHLDPQRLQLPWIAPSLPWWDLDDRWGGASARQGKTLLFSRFRAVPQAVAGLLSFQTETELFRGRNISWNDVTAQRLLQPRAESSDLLALFHPSRFLIEASDPLEEARRSGTSTILSVLTRIREQLRDALGAAGIRVLADSGTNMRPLWELMVRLDAHVGHWGQHREAWLAVHTEIGKKDEAGLAALVANWDACTDYDLTTISESELQVLADGCLSAPGIVLGRALRRHWPEALEDKNFRRVCATAWNGLRNYFAQRWIGAALTSSAKDYPSAIRRAVIAGNFEALLDEHLWIAGQIRSCKGSALANDLSDALVIRTSTTRLHAPDGSDSTFTLRCHVAMPFTDSQSYGQDAEQSTKIRPDQLRTSFNSPFLPHVLATTSVGQEGLDFHVWCREIIHWDLPHNPVDLEQREGRIQRYGGLAVRQAIADKLGVEALHSTPTRVSPWTRLAELAEERIGDASGLAPWWVVPDGGIRRYVFDVPMSREAQQLTQLKRQRFLYRLALGQPNQEDLVEYLDHADGLDSDTARQAAVGLSPWFDRETRQVTAAPVEEDVV